MVLEQILLCTLGHTAQHADNQRVLIRAATFFPASAALGIEGFQTMVDFLFGIIPHTAGIEEDGISRFQTVGGFVTSHLHYGGHHLGVCHVHLATIGLNI